MGRENQPKVRQASALVRKKAKRGSYDRILIVCEGSKTEPQYLDEIRSYHKIHTANVQVHRSLLGTECMQVVECAEQLFLKGDITLSINPRAFERVYAVFDRDDHKTYHAALAKAETLKDKLRNDLGQKVFFNAVASVPCFELWLLLHFQDVLAPIHRTEAYARLRQHISDYDKGRKGYFLLTRESIDDATTRACQLAARTSAANGIEPYTNLHDLVHLLITLKVD